MGSLAGDIKSSVRQLAKAPGFTIAAVVVLSLGIGLNAAMFSLVYAFGFMGRAYADPEQVVQLYSSQAKKVDSYRAFSYAAYREIAGQPGPFSGLLAHTPTMVGLNEGGHSRRTMAELTSRNYFDVLGVPVVQGRGFTDEEDRPGQDIPVVIASLRLLAAHRLQARPGRLDRSRSTSGPTRWSGITPRGFTGTMMIAGPELFFPLGVFHTLSDDFEGESDRSLLQPGCVQPVPGRAPGGRRDAGGRVSAPRQRRPATGAGVPGRVRRRPDHARAVAAIRHDDHAEGRGRACRARRHAARAHRRGAADRVPQPRGHAHGAGPRPPQGVRDSPRPRRRPRPHRPAIADRRVLAGFVRRRRRRRPRAVRHHLARECAGRDAADLDRARGRAVAGPGDCDVVVLRRWRRPGSRWAPPFAIRAPT